MNGSVFFVSMAVVKAKKNRRRMKGVMHWADKGRRMAERARELFPPGTRIQLIHMDDPYNPVPDGTRGTVKFVDDMGTVFPDWDNGRGLGVVYGEDSFRKLTPEELLEEQQKEDINQDTDMGMNMGM